MNKVYNFIKKYNKQKTFLISILLIALLCIFAIFVYHIGYDEGYSIATYDKNNLIESEALSICMTDYSLIEILEINLKLHMHQYIILFLLAWLIHGVGFRIF